uniref:Protein berghei strain anka n=1 Tax=Ixodes ricinus TaxID=34613 RepID=A0A147BMV6_IXORI
MLFIFFFFLLLLLSILLLLLKLRHLSWVVYLSFVYIFLIRYFIYVLWCAMFISSRKVHQLNPNSCYSQTISRKR